MLQVQSQPYPSQIPEVKVFTKKVYQVLVAGSYKCGFWKKMLEAVPTSNGAKTASSETDPLLAKASPAVEVPLGECTQERGKVAAQQQRQPERSETM